MKDYIAYIGAVVANCHSDDYKPWYFNQRKEITRNSIGLVINLEKSSYVLTCLHGIKNAYELNFYSFDIKSEGRDKDKIRKIQLDLATYSTESDLALLKMKVDDIEGVNIDTFDQKIPSIDARLKLYLVDYKHRSRDHIDIIKNIYNCVNENITFENQQSFNMPLLPYINIMSSKLLKDKFSYSELRGISGSIVLDENDTIVGIILSVTDDNVISILPSVTIRSFLEEFIKKGNFNGLCNILAQVSFCSIDIDEREEKFCYLIDNNFGINYNTCSLYDNITKRSNLKNGDMIFKIDNREFDSDGTVYCEKMDCKLPLSTYIALNYMCGDSIPLTIFRNTPKGSYDEKNININARPCWTAKYLPDVFNGNYSNYNGMIFIELSEELIDDYNNHNIMLVGSSQDNYELFPYRNGNDRVIVLIDILRKDITDEETEAFDKLKLPLINIKGNMYNILVIKKINGKKVSNINTLKKLFKNSNKNNILFQQTKDIKVSFTYTNDKFESMKYIKRDN
jgi:hypothetical protein